MPAEIVGAHEREILQLLTGDEESVARGIEAVHAEFRDPICAIIRTNFPGMPAADVADAWQETLTDLFRAARVGRLSGGPHYCGIQLFPWLVGFARRKAIDRIRHQTRTDEVLDGVATQLKNTQIGRKWQEMDVVERQEAMDLIREAIATASDTDRLVFQAFVNGFPGTVKTEVLCAEVATISERHMSPKSIRRAFLRARERVKRFLRGKGFDIC